MPTTEQQIAALEKKLAGIKSTKSRMEILSSLCHSYSADINDLYSGQISEAKKGLEFKNPDQKKDVEAIIKAIKAVVVLKEGRTATEQEIRDFCRDQLAGYKRPKSVDFIAPDEMPRNATGKILHRILRERYDG